nr:hypothetical protein [Candidatus Brocadiales bacterium]
PPDKSFSGLEDYLGFDNETCALIHLHVHYKLVLGQRYIKNHHLPIENIFFDNLTLKYGISVPVPELELILLIIRAHMKMGLISIIKHGIRELQGRSYCPFPSDIEQEMSHLISAYDRKRFGEILHQCSLSIPLEMYSDFIDKFSTGEYTCKDIVLYKLKILRSLHRYRRDKGVFLLIKYYKLLFYNSRIIEKFISQKKKTLNSGGRIISLIGADGSGKSSHLKDLQDWLSWKLSVSTYYYGIPKNILVDVADYMAVVAQKLKLSMIASLIENCMWVFIARNRYKVFLASIRESMNGKVVITDRFPMKEFREMEIPMDGPRIAKGKSGIGRLIARAESGYYNKIQMPDCILVLQVDIEKLRERKSDLDMLLHEKKAAAVNAINGDERVVLINANKPYTDVQFDIKRQIWNVL